MGLIIKIVLQQIDLLRVVTVERLVPSNGFVFDVAHTTRCSVRNRKNPNKSARSNERVRIPDVLRCKTTKELAKGLCDG